MTALLGAFDLMSVVMYSFIFSGGLIGVVPDGSGFLREWRGSSGRLLIWRGGHVFTFWVCGSVVGVGGVRLICCDTAFSAEHMIHRVTSRFRGPIGRCSVASSVLGSSISLKDRRSLLVIKMPSCTNEIPRVTIHSLEHFLKGGAPTVVMYICNGETCSSALVRLGSLIRSRNFGVLSTTTIVTRRSVFPGVTRKEPSTSSVTGLRSFTSGDDRLLSRVSGVTTIDQLVMGNGHPCHSAGPVPLRPRKDGKGYASYRTYIGVYPIKTVARSRPCGAGRGGYVSYNEYMIIYPRRTHRFKNLLCGTID